jgi:hypothetical protein
MHAENAERNEQAEGRFGAVGGRAESIETENGDASEWPNLLGALVTGLEGLANNQIENVHLCAANEISPEFHLQRVGTESQPKGRAAAAVKIAAAREE